jgi:hypothetical protein
MEMDSAGLTALARVTVFPVTVFLATAGLDTAGFEMPAGRALREDLVGFAIVMSRAVFCECEKARPALRRKRSVYE